MWMVRDSDTTIFLFGTFHALDGRTPWFRDNVRLAFAAADELVLETVIPKQRALSGSTAVESGEARPAATLMIAPGGSFLASTRLAVSAGMERGMQVAKGADMVLRRAAEFEGKKVEGLETFDFQLGMFNRMAPVQMKPSAISEDQSQKAQLATVMSLMQSAWNRGDQRVFADILDQMRVSSPDNYRIMFPERNAHWANWIVDRMDRPGTVFLAVGAGHFAGPDSVLSKLTMKGVVATRVN
jgi:hypothetical protein